MNRLSWVVLGELQLSDVSRDNKKLKIFYADPFDYKSIIDALKGCSGLFYSFEPPQDQPNYDVCSFLFVSFPVFFYSQILYVEIILVAVNIRIISQ